MINVTGAIIICNNQILLAQRGKGKYMEFHWEFPGGKQEAGETLEECLLREVKEEIGLEVNVKMKIDEFKWSDHRGDFCLHSFICSCGNPGITSIPDHEQYKWLTIDELSDYNVVPGDKPSIKKLQSLGADLFKLL